MRISVFKWKILPQLMSYGNCCVSQTRMNVNAWHGRGYSPVNSYSVGSGSPTTQDIQAFLRSKNIKAFSGPTCFKCENIFPKPKTIGRPKKTEETAFTLFINKTTGNFYCTATGRTGSWKDICNLMKNSMVKTAIDIPVDKNNADLQKIVDLWSQSLPMREVLDITREEILVKFGLDRLPLNDLEMNEIRLSSNAESIIVPWFPNSNTIGMGRHAMKGTPIGLKVFSLEKENPVKFDVRRYPTNSYYGMLGLSQVPTRIKSIVLTMNEFDAVAINCGSSCWKAASLPCGITYLPLEVLPYLEHFSEIILWFDNSQLSWEAARQFAKKLNENRCRLVRPTTDAPNPLAALSSNLDMNEIISSAVSAEIRNIVSFADLRGFVKDELMNYDTASGVKSLRFPKLTQKLKGHRRGELTVFTGPTGSGKTTFISEYSLDLAMQGVSTLWGSFEIQNVRLIKTMMKQYSRSRLENHMADFEKVAEKFQRLPVHFMTYNGPQTIKDVIHTMRQAAYVHDIQHIIIDNLQFMMGAMSKNNDRFMVQDMLISEFRNFATTENVHVTVVIHPRKEDAGMPLQISSIFGTAKATQEADNVLILQQVVRMEEGTSVKNCYIEVVKNRYDGDLGKIAVYFDRKSLCMSKPPGMDSLDDELAENVKIVNDEAAAKLNGGGIFSDDVLIMGSKPKWLEEWNSDVDDV